jgi:hypothetical protein
MTNVADEAQLLQRLWDLEEIKQLKARYFRLMDTKQWDQWKDLFTEDCVHYLPLGVNVDVPAQTNEDYLQQVPQALSNSITVHHGHMPEITFLSGTEAEGIWAMFDYVQGADSPAGIHGYGHYYETYRKCEDGAWRISSKRNARIRVDQVSYPPPGQ